MDSNIIGYGELKFRAIRPSTNQWVYGANVSLEATINTPNIIRLSKFFELIELGQFKKTTLSQYIGRKDKNGKEIFRGDIVLLKWQKYDRGIYEVKFGEGCNHGAGDSSGYFYGYYLQTAEEVHSDYLIEDDMNLEVVGDIFNNPELLKEA